MNILQIYSWQQFTPAFALVGLALILLMADAFLPKAPRRSYALIAGIGAFIIACFQLQGANPNIMGFLACIATSACLFIAYDYSQVTCDSVNGGKSDEGTGEMYILPLIACAGICVLTQAQDLIMLFAGLEVLTLSSYCLAGYYRRNQGSIEAGVKYLILGGISTAILVFGAAWYFGMTGSFSISPQVLAQCIGKDQEALQSAPILSAGLLFSYALLLVGITFKVGLAPMQMWIPDVYQGAPTPVTAFLAVASKIAGFVVLMSVTMPLLMLLGLFEGLVMHMYGVLTLLAAATLLIGNLGAIKQMNAKRLLAYSSIGQAGFILLFFLGPIESIPSSTALYLAAYGLATLGAFTAIALVRQQRGSEEIAAFNGLGKTNPRLSFLITIFMSSLAGVPLTWGFIAKLSSFGAVIIGSKTIGIAIYVFPIAVIAAAAGFYYYFKILRAIYWEPAEENSKALCIPTASGIIMVTSALLLIWFGIEPLLYM